MTSLQRLIIVSIMLIGVTVLVIIHYSDANIAVAIGLYGTILGYVFGNRNGEKALAGAILQAQANAVSPTAAVSPGSFNTAASSALGNESMNVKEGDNPK